MSAFSRKPRKRLTRAPARVEDPRTREEDVERGLEAIYRQPVTSDEQVFSGRSPLRGARIVSGIIALCGMCSFAAWAGWMWLGPTRASVAPPLDVRVQAPTALTIGEPTAVRVHWKNPSTSPIRHARFQLLLPAHADIAFVQPAFTNAQQSVWEKEFVGGLEEGDYTAAILPLGALHEETFAQLLVSVIDANGVAREQQPIVTSFVYDGSSLTFTPPVIPTRAIPGEKVVTRWMWSQTTSSRISGAQMRITYPETFQPAVATGTILDTEHRQLVASLAGNAARMISLVGTFLPAHVTQGQFVADIGRTDEHGSWLSFQRVSSTMSVAPPDFAVSMVVNGAEDGVVLEPGGVVRVTVRYENTTPDTLEHAVITVAFDAHTTPSLKKPVNALFDARAIEATPSAVTGTKGSVTTVTFTEKTVPALARIPHGGDGTLDVYFPLTHVPTGTKDMAISVGAHADFTRAQQQRSVVLPERVLPFISDVGLASTVRFSTDEGAPIVGGPIPPQVGATTTYRVFLDLTKHLHTLQGITVQTTLPDRVALHGTSSTTDGALQFDPLAHTLSWIVPMFATSSEALHAWFDIDIVPTAADVGQFLPLTGSTTFDAVDATIGRRLHRAVDGYTTDLEDDVVAKGHGAVRVPPTPKASSKKTR